MKNLENRDMGEPSTEYPSLVNKVLKLRKIPLNQFSLEDLRLMIGQNKGLPYLIQLSLDVLKEDLFAEGDFYPSDLLQNILKVPALFWTEDKELWQDIHGLIKDRMEEILEHDISVKMYYDIAI